MEIALIAAMDENRLIGADGDLPWHYPEDLAHFKALTEGHPVVMGRVTYESIVDGLGTPLPNRDNIVLTTRGIDTTEPNVTVVASIEDALVQAGRVRAKDSPLDTSVVYIIGGASVYEQFLPRADRLEVTRIHETYEGDAYFPEWDPTEWEETTRDDREDLSFVTYERR